MTSNLNIFSILDNFVKADVTFRNNIQVIVSGIGTVGILTKQWKKKNMDGVYYVERLKYNLMRIGKLLHKG